MLPSLPSRNTPIPNTPFSSPQTPATFDRLFGANVPNIQLSPNPSSLAGDLPVAPWVRPSDWLAMPSVRPQDSTFVGLAAIYDTANFFSIYAEGDYTVDWGDGTVESYDSEETAVHYYDFNNRNLDGTLTTEGFKQAIVKVTPNSGTFTYFDFIGYECSANWIEIVMNFPGTPNGGMAGFDYIAQFIPHLQKVTILNPGNQTSLNNWFSACYSLRSVTINNMENVVSMSETFYACENLTTVNLFGTQNLEYLDYAFEYCYSLTQVQIEDTSSLTEAYGMFYDCYSLQVAPELDLSGVSNLNYFFNYCENLVQVPNYNTASATSMESMFEGCRSLKTIPNLNYESLEDASSIFENCEGLETVSLGDMPNVLDLSYAFRYCTNLRNISIGSTPSLENIHQMFQDCRSLVDAPMLDTSEVYDMSYMFEGCISLKNVPLYDTANAEYTYSMFYGCSSLETVPPFNLTSAYDVDDMFYHCESLVEVPDFVLGTNLQYMEGMLNYCYNLTNTPSWDVNDVYVDWAVNYCYKLADISFTNNNTYTGYRNNNLGAVELNSIFTSLASASEDIDVSYNYGVYEAAFEPEIANAKGWTIYY